MKYIYNKRRDEIEIQVQQWQTWTHVHLRFVVVWTGAVHQFQFVFMSNTILHNVFSRREHANMLYTHIVECNKGIEKRIMPSIRGIPKIIRWLRSHKCHFMDNFLLNSIKLTISGNQSIVFSYTNCGYSPQCNSFEYLYYKL